MKIPSANFGFVGAIFQNSGNSDKASVTGWVVCGPDQPHSVVYLYVKRFTKDNIDYKNLLSFIKMQRQNLPLHFYKRLCFVWLCFECNFFAPEMCLLFENQLYKISFFYKKLRYTQHIYFLVNEIRKRSNYNQNYI